MRLLLVSLLSALPLALGGVAAPYPAYPGPEKPAAETALFSYKGAGGMGLTPRTWVYKVDGETRAQFRSGVLPFGYNKTHSVGGFALALLPGEHSVEIGLNDRKGPMTKVAARIEAQRIHLRVAAGGRYRFSHDGFAITIAAEAPASAGSPVFSVEEVPPYAEPPETAPHATLTYTHAGKADIDPYVLRVDDQVTAAAGGIDGVNYALPVFKSFSAGKGALTLRLAPGPHHLEWMALGDRVIDGLIQHTTVNLEAGRKYQLQIDKTEIKGSELSTATLRLVEY